MVARYSARHGLSCTAHQTEAAALGYVRYLYCIPADVADSDVVSWVSLNTGDQALVTYDDPAQEPR
ncbi:hypothetical protein DQP56_00235 [Mycolicibacter senuensis]|uniref:Uncharacterized protein n=2 Tax=Mycobacteriaceae TaxID=1762 RepID=A0A1X1YAE2_9MYCO|nr:hypothetical protein AWC16_20275 [Mycolicibacter longobardus]RAV04281.1 hypothetical protein DQP56_00235 [Mycolicibacter senuensis]